MEPELTLNLSEAEVNIILEGLQDLPFKKSHNLIRKIMEQANNQLKKD